MWRTWRWKASRRIALHPLATFSWVPKTTPATRASAFRRETVLAPACLKSAFVEKVSGRSAPRFPTPPHPTLLPKSLTLFFSFWWLYNGPPWPFKNALPVRDWVWCLTFPLFKHTNFTQYVVQWLTILTVCGGHWSILWQSLSEVWLLWYGNQHWAAHMRTMCLCQIGYCN